MRVVSGVVAICLCATMVACAENTVDPKREAIVEPTSLPALLPLRLLLADDDLLVPQISPDGKWLSWIGQYERVPNFFVAPIGDVAAARAITRYTGRGVQATDVSGVVMYRWHADSTHLIYPMDYDGDENWDIHVVDVTTGEDRNLTSSKTVRDEIIAYGSRHPDDAVLQVGEHNPMLPDLYRIQLSTGKRSALDTSGKYIGFLADNDLAPRLAVTVNAAGGIDVLRRAGDAWQPYFVVAPDDLPAMAASSYQKIYRFDATNTYLYMYDVEGRDTTALVRMNLDSGAKDVIAQDPRVDLAGILYDPATNAPLAHAVNWTRTSWHAIDPSLAADIGFLNERAAGDWTVVSQSTDNRKWVVRDMLSHKPIEFLLYDRDARSLSRLFSSTPKLEGLALSRMHPYVVKTDDGFDLVSYVLLPPWTDPDDDGRPDRPLPVVVLVHGGPSDERAQFAFGPFVHWLANRGYGVLYVNFRGSAGFGKKFMNAQNREWGGRMHQDVLEQVNWAVKERIADPARIGILGGSYGGYEVLVAMTMTPDKFACGIDLVGPSNLEIFMPHWDEDRMGVVIGDRRTPEGRALLKSRSPINFAAQTKHPVLIGQGAKDARVPQDQSDTVVDAMQKNGVAVTYALYPDEGHGLMREANSFSFWAIGEAFLARCLGGRAEPIGNALEGSSVTVPVGAEHIPGLPEALARRTHTD
jgi:dipeptidyl aminopeptidase/acylaminoacyl peptidase